LATKPDLLDLRRPSQICLIQCFIWNSLTGTQPISSFCNRTFIFNFLVIDDYIIDVLNILPLLLLFIQESLQVLESTECIRKYNLKIESCLPFLRASISDTNRRVGIVGWLIRTIRRLHRQSTPSRRRIKLDYLDYLDY